MATRPHLLLLDDPTTGLDPITAVTVNDEILKLRDVEHVTTIAATHQIRDAFYVAEHAAVRSGNRTRIVAIDDASETSTVFMVLHEGRIRFQGSGIELRASRDPYLKEFLFMTLPPW
jgi:ABC-type transporter Mla maintaining outer membrane lipid asymmetry ATPase subunit MlaF